jgi:HTH-type transcriptional regulator / antitoxin HigA
MINSNSDSASEYGSLLHQARPHVIHSEEEHLDFVKTLASLAAKSEVTEAEVKLIELLTVLIEVYESQVCPVPDADPRNMIRHLMDVNGLRQKDLVDVFGTESIVSDVLSGRRDLTKDHIKRLSERFSVSPAVFF